MKEKRKERKKEMRGKNEKERHRKGRTTGRHGL